MKKLIALASLWFALGAAPALAVNVNIDGLPAGGAVAGANLFECEQGGVNNNCTATQILTFINAQFSGDLTVTAGGVVTLKNTGPGATGPIGNATSTPIVTIDAQGRVTGLTGTPITPSISNVTGMGANVPAWLLSATSANLAAALTDETGTGVAVFGTAPTISSPTINTAATLGFITGSTQCLHVNTSGVLSGTGSDCGAGGGAVSSVTGGIGVTVSPTTGAVVVSAAFTTRNNTATTDTITSTDKGTVVTESNAASVAVAITTAGFVANDYFTVKNKGAGLATYTPSSGQIDGVGTLTVKQNQAADLYFDGTNYWTLPGRPTNVAASDLVGIGTNVAAAINTTLSAAGGLTSTIASGTSALGTSAIASAACATVVTTTATNTATTDVVTASFNGDPTAVTGYIPATAGMLTIIAYPTANNVNFKVCNNTSASITPGAITLNWRVAR